MFQKGLQKLKSFSLECKRVLMVTRKPNQKEFKTIFKISGIGLMVIGLIGFMIAILMKTLKL